MRSQNPITRLVLLAPAVLTALVVSGCAAPTKRPPAQVETVDPAGFTITEDVRLDQDVLGEYDRAMQLLGQERYPEGIALLEQVTTSAPNVTAPFINL
ncbi:MAG TPA: hypothetical protein VLT59_01160, partial [Steroidobacteraceae bacterium]|nr:hypothetical protein [Steroidobacteraceae bacterium]